jgi:hypothetical protein
MIPTAFAHAHATLHVHPETLAFAAVGFALSLVALKFVTARWRRGGKP